jgi:hypothetical protein
MFPSFSGTHPFDASNSRTTAPGSSGTPKRLRLGHETSQIFGDNSMVDLDAASAELFRDSDDALTQISVIDPFPMVARKSLHPEGASWGHSDFDNGNKEECDPPTDVLSVYLTDDVIFKILNFLSPHDLVHRLGMVNRHYLALSRDNAAGWNIYFSNLTSTKLHVAVADPLSNFRTAYRQAIVDSRRPFITTQELCYDLATHQGTIWSFRFKESAGTDWTSVDPWYLGQPCRKMVFLSTGTMLNAILPSSSGWHVSPNETIQLVEPPLRMTWRFLTRPMDLPTRPMGSYIRIQVGGRDVPTYATSRSPTGNWGFVLESCWGIYASFELPKRIAPTNEVNPDTATAVLRRVSDGSVVWVQRDDGTDEENASIGGVSWPPRAMVPSDMQDETMTLTNEIQWREAFLYNVGARVLPEGDEATDEFDRFWRDVRGNNHQQE